MVFHEPSKRPNDGSPYTVENDRFDREEFNRLEDEIEQFALAREKLVDNIAGDLGHPVWQDAWLLFWKAVPEILHEDDVRTTHRVNHMVISEAVELPEYTKLRVWTQGDDIASVLACITIEPDIETLYDRNKEAQKAANELNDALNDLADKRDEQKSVEQLFEEWTAEHDPDAEENQEQASDFAEQQAQIEAALDDLAGDAAEKEKTLGEALEEAKDGTQVTLREALDKAADAAKAMASMSKTWGHDPGDPIRLSAARRYELAKRINDNPRFKRIAELFGLIERFAAMVQRRKVNYLREEIVGVTAGDDIPHVLPSKQAQMSMPGLKWLFWADWAMKRLPQWEYTGYENVAKGGIIYIHDGSNSMQGEREEWAKGVGLALLHIARKQNRSFVAVQFGSPGQIRVDNFDTKRLDPETLLDFAEYFYNGGTHFDKPLDRGVEFLEAEHKKTGAIKSDIVFATDGECDVSDPWFTNFKAAQKRLDFRVWGINLGDPAEEDSAFYRICDGKIATVRDLTSGKDLAPIFAGI